MTVLTDHIERYFKSFINEREPYNFFIGLADYIRFVYTRPESKLVVLELEKQCLHEYKELEQLKTKSLMELQQPIKEIVDLKNTFAIQEVISGITQLENYIQSKKGDHY